MGNMKRVEEKAFLISLIDKLANEYRDNIKLITTE